LVLETLDPAHDAAGQIRCWRRVHEAAHLDYRGVESLGRHHVFRPNPSVRRRPRWPL
jgi:hypothetical protein